MVVEAVKKIALSLMLLSIFVTILVHTLSHFNHPGSEFSLLLFNIVGITFSHEFLVPCSIGHLEFQEHNFDTTL